MWNLILTIYFRRLPRFGEVLKNIFITLNCSNVLSMIRIFPAFTNAKFKLCELQCVTAAWGPFSNISDGAPFFL